ncbi:MAG: helix-turn-helix transcriptional regulator [Chitinophagales bacterium]|nr:helix-turn-helix transcriptional regulator [Chitinophagaceae bacterium]MCB9065243.1 helix-turn-helix transcriptional regulator [Chitinophagales bacterium]
MKVAVQHNVRHTAPIERILGQQVEVLGRTPVQVNNYVKAEYIEISYPENAWPEEHARLSLFPIADGRFYVHIMYLQIDDKEETGQVCWLEYKPEFFDQYPLESIAADIPFKFDKVVEQQFNICTQSSQLLSDLLTTNEPTAFARILKQTEVAIYLFRRAMECITMPFTVCPVPACSFLANESEHSKVIQAQNVIRENLDSPLTIKELSRKVAMNECYLKKGFKALTGKTIHQYTQELRISKAKQLLNEQGLSVSDVANTLGYSSISHFSTAFKKATGTKPCELLK